MNTMFFIFKLVFRPFNTFYNMMFKKDRKTPAILKPIKYALVTLVSVFSFAIVVGALDEDREILFGSNNNKIYVEQVDGSVNNNVGNNQLDPSNPDGTINGLNLQLIDNITTEGFVKDYLTTLRDFYNGKLTASGQGLPVDVVIGSSISESNTYTGTPLPKTYLPWDDSANSPFWNKSVGGLPSEATTLKLANKNVFSVDYLSYARGPLYTNSVAIGDAGGDDSVTPFQINHFNDGTYTKSILNGYNVNSSRDIDATYFPDSLSALALRFENNVLNLVPASKGMDIEYLIAMYSAQHNPGSGALTDDFLNFVDRNDVDAVLGQAKIFVDDLTAIDKKYGSILSNIDTGGNGRAFVALALISEQGWKYFDMYGTPSLLVEFGSTFENATGKSPIDVMKGNLASIPSYARGNAGGGSYTGLTKTVDGKSVRLDSIAMYHMWQYLFGGKYYYAKMLKYAGVNVDPTDPNTYMNTLPEGEWKPGGDSIWMTNEGVDMDKLNSQNEKILKEGFKYLGLPYIFGGNDPTVGLDCSSYVQWVYRRSLGIELPRTTYDQVNVAKKISKSDAKPGDLVFYYTASGSCEHVAIYLGMDGNSPKIMHAPDVGSVIKITTWDGGGYYVNWDIRRIDGVNQ